MDLAADGYVILPVFSMRFVEELRAALDPLFALADDRDATADMLGHSKRHFILDPALDLRAAHRMVPETIRCVERVLEPEVIFEGGCVMVAEEGAVYAQGWHRDTQQVPPEQVDERMFSPGYIHNCVQCNVALYDDDALWIVPGSHGRPFTETERELFGDEWQTAENVDMPGGQAVELRAGEGVFYNNNLIHRGHSAHRRRRLTYHASHHSTQRPPTWHFYNRQFQSMTAEDIAALEPDVRRLVEASLKRREEYPDVTATYRIRSSQCPLSVSRGSASTAAWKSNTQASWQGPDIVESSM